MERKKEPAGRLFFQLSLSGIAGIGTVMFCLFLWMFLLGVWAGQTILFRPPPVPAAAEVPVGKTEAAEPVSADPAPENSVQILLPLARKKRVGQPGLSAAEGSPVHQPDITEE